MAEAKDKAVYYNANLDGATLDILKRNADGTVDLGTGKTVAVKSCPVSKVAREGCATLGADPVEPPVSAETPSAAATATAQVAFASAK